MLNRKIRNARVEVVGGQIVAKENKRENAARRTETNLAIIVNQIKNRKGVSKAKAMKLGKIKLAELLEGDKTSFMSLAYSVQECEVGKITVNFATICSLTKDAWTNADGTINQDLFYAAFVCADRENPGEEESWRSIYQVEAGNVAKGVRLMNYVEMAYDIYRVSNLEMAAFINQMQNLNPAVITYEDIVRIQADLYHLFRGFQESSLDVVKDETKCHRYNWDDIIGYVPKLYPRSKDDYFHNIEEVINDKVPYQITFTIKDGAAETRNDILSGAVKEVHEKFINNEVLATAEDSIVELMEDVLETSNILADEVKLHAESLISVVAASFKAEDGLSKDMYKAVRDALYTLVSEVVEDEDAATAMVLDLIIAKYHRDYKGRVVRNHDISKLRQGCAKMILGGILPLYLNGKQTYTRVFGPKEFTLFQELEDGQRFEIADGDIIADGVLVGCLKINDDDADSICEIATDAAYVVEGNLYIEQNIYDDVCFNCSTAIIEQLYAAGATVEDIKSGAANDDFGKDTYYDLLDQEVIITGKKHNIVAMVDENGRKAIRGKLNDYSAVMLKETPAVEITAANTIAVHVPYDPEKDRSKYNCEIVVFF